MSDCLDGARMLIERMAEPWYCGYERTRWGTRNAGGNK